MKRARQDVSELGKWLETYGVKLHGIDVQKTQFGSGLITARSLSPDEEPLIHVPSTLILSLDYVWQQAKTDSQLKEVLEGTGEFGQSARGAILIFLLLQIAATSPDVKSRIGVENPWTAYVQFLPTETTLPTFWSDSERLYAGATTLAPAIEAKLGSLEREFTLVTDALRSLSWCENGWLSESKGSLTIEDWKVVDAIWRSRAMEIPTHGLCMVPAADMANHAHGDRVNARTNVQHDTGDVRLVLDTTNNIATGKDINITYGEEKGACEMIFSYGFIDSTMQRAESMFLDLEAPDDDPLFAAKKHVFDCPPGFRISNQQSSTDVTWIGPFVWLLCVNEEDGLNFEVVQEEDGSKRLRADWKGTELKTVIELDEALNKDENWELFRLRAYSLVNERVRGEIEMRTRFWQSRRDAGWWTQRDESSSAWQLSLRLRDLEWQMLNQANRTFGDNSEVVKKWFNVSETPDDGEIDTTYEDECGDS